MMHVGDLTKMCNESYWILVHWLVKCEMHLCMYLCKCSWLLTTDYAYLMNWRKYVQHLVSSVKVLVLVLD